MILESIVTTVDPAGRVNVAPMGPRVDDEACRQFVLRPFDSSRTFANLTSSGRAVVHVTDDVSLFAKAAVGRIEPEGLVEPIDQGDWWRLRDCHRWFAVEVESVSDERPRADVRCRVVRSETVRPFFGFNRAKHAVIEAAILATRTHLIAPETIDQQLEWLQPLVDKTAGPAEREAFDFLCQTIRRRRMP